jgi:hypothetical protein
MRVSYNSYLHLKISIYKVGSLPYTAIYKHMHSIHTVNLNYIQLCKSMPEILQKIDCLINYGFTSC